MRRSKHWRVYVNFLRVGSPALRLSFPLSMSSSSVHEVPSYPRFYFCLILFPHPFSPTWFVSSASWALQSVDRRIEGAGLERAPVAMQWLPHQSTPDQSSQQASHHKKHRGGCSDCQDGVPTYLTLLGRGDRKTVVLRHTVPAGGHL